MEVPPSSRRHRHWFLPVMKEVQAEAERRRVKLYPLPTEKAIELLKQNPSETNAILHATC